MPHAQLVKSDQWNQLIQTIQQNRLSHAYILSGLSDIDKNDFAFSIANFLLCEQPDRVTGAGCNNCTGCQWMRAKTHPDFYRIIPHEKNHSIKIDQIRELSEKIMRTSQCGGYQVVIISPASAMPIAASHSLLKTLEEPPGKTVFLLVCDQMDRLLPTIRSRCQSIIFNRIEKIENKKHNELPWRNQMIDHLFAMIGNPQYPIHFISEWISYDINAIFYVLLTIGIDITRIKTNTLDFVINQDHIKNIQKITHHISVTALEHWLQLVLEKKRLLAQGINLNTQLMLENLVIEWGKCRVH